MLRVVFKLMKRFREVREIATKAKERKKLGEVKPYVDVDLRKCDAFAA